ncbi:hypothetical protein AMECASPLE_023010 [Ameca splendens]|uniref:Uncharacterized protein n=1 Tax=Ameca splendens TaxID=208324 RepID=A0ABV0XSV2_9TELE
MVSCDEADPRRWWMCGDLLSLSAALFGWEAAGGWFCSGLAAGAAASHDLLELPQEHSQKSGAAVLPEYSQF